jgi:hypothetical protein
VERDLEEENFLADERTLSVALTTILINLQLRAQTIQEGCSV